MTREAVAVRRRTVFYIEGYDPRGPAHYHGLYRDEAAKQAAVNGLALTVGPRRRIDAIQSAWDVRSEETETSYIFLRYDDIMRARWSKTDSEVLWDVGRFAWAFLTRGVYGGMVRHARPILAFTTMAPALVLLALLASLASGVGVGIYTTWYIGIAAGATVMLLLLLLRRRFDQALPAFWIARICAFSADQGIGRAADMEERIDAFADRIVAAWETGDADEVLVVGHSVGTQIGVSVCARVLGRLRHDGRRLSFLTLGQTIPLIAFQPPAEAYRKELAGVAADPRLDWIDVASPADGLCFPLIDPLTVCGLAQPDPARPKPLLVSPRYHTLFADAVYRKMKRDFYRTHFQYLMATERPGQYDYFRITAGPLRLADHFGANGSKATDHA